MCRISEEMATDAVPLYPLGKVAELSCNLPDPTAATSHKIMMNLACVPSAKRSFARWYKPLMEPSHDCLQGASAARLNIGINAQYI